MGTMSTGLKSLTFRTGSDVLLCSAATSCLRICVSYNWMISHLRNNLKLILIFIMKLMEHNANDFSDDALETIGSNSSTFSQEISSSRFKALPGEMYPCKDGSITLSKFNPRKQ